MSQKSFTVLLSHGLRTSLRSQENNKSARLKLETAWVTQVFTLYPHTQCVFVRDEPLHWTVSLDS